MSQCLIQDFVNKILLSFTDDSKQNFYQFFQNLKKDSFNFDWKTILYILEKHDLKPLFFYNLKQLNFLKILPEDIFNNIKDSYNSTLAKNMYLLNEYEKINNILINSNVQAIPLKGIHMLYVLYPFIGLRPMSDIDILVHKSDLNIIDKILLENGFKGEETKSKKYFEKYHFHYHYYKPNIILEVHWKLTQKNYFYIDMNNIWSRVKLIENKQNICLMSLEDTIIYLILHLVNHCIILRLLWLYEIHYLITKNLNNINWEYILKIIKSHRFKYSMFLVLSFLQKYCQTNIPIYVFQELKFDSKIRNYFFNSIVYKNNIFTNKLDKFEQILFRILIMDKYLDMLNYLLSSIPRYFSKYNKLSLKNGTKNFI